jgi:capsular polysaccharide biosynthesis protein
MIETPQTETKPGRRQLQDETQLIDYLVVIWKWKYLILGGTVLCAVAAGIISLAILKLKPQDYIVSTVIEPGIKMVDKNGSKTYIDSAINLKNLIDRGEAKYKISEGLKTFDGLNLTTSWPFKITIPQQTSFLHISYASSKPERGINILEHMNKLLVNWYDERFLKRAQRNCEDSILLEMNKLAGLKAAETVYREDFERNILNAKRRVSDLRLSADEAENNIKKILNEKAVLDSSMKALKRDVEQISERKVSGKNGEEQSLSTNILQQYLSLENSYYKRGISYRSESVNEKNRLRQIKSEIAILQTVMEHAEKTKINGGDLVMLQWYLELATIPTEIEDIQKGKKNGGDGLFFRTYIELMRFKTYLDLMKQATITDTNTINTTIIAMQRIGVELFQIGSLIEKRAIEIETLKKQKKEIQGIQIVQPPTARIVTANKTMRNIALAALVGLFAMLFLSFLFEYIQRYKARLRE